jgi:hypothetical protein
MPAESLYSSELFYRSRRYAQANFDSWLILSAKHGLLKPDQLVSPYDCKLTTLSSSERAELSRRVAGQASVFLEAASRFTSICGEDYDDVLLKAGIPFSRNAEFALPIGKKLKALGLVSDPAQSQPLLDATYKSISRLAKASGFVRLGDALKRGMPDSGVYLFFDENERRLKDLSALRVVRVGTHGVASGSKATLRNRLRTHFGTGTGDGNHRSSIFRLHTGRSLINAKLSPELTSWGTPSSEGKDVPLSERKLEQAVSKYLAELYVLLIDVPGASDKGNDRAYIEQNLIALLSNKCSPLDPPSFNWLGLSSDKREIRKSGLWNVNHVEQNFDPGYLEVLNYYVSSTIGAKPQPKQQLAPANWQARIRDDTRQLSLL